jgi:hypothetical protein
VIRSDASPSPGSSAPATGQLCISVTRPASSIQRGQSGTFALQVWTQNVATPTGTITIKLSAQPAGPVAEFSLCGSGNKTATCTTSTPGSTPTALQAQVAVASNATSVTSVTLKAVADPAATPLKQPPTAVETAQVTAPGKSSSPSNSKSGTSSVGNGGTAGNGLSGATSNIPVGPIPALNNAGSSLINPGDASGLFPQISPSDSPSPAPGAGSRASNTKAGPTTTSLLPLGMPVVTAQVVGLIALAIALMLAMTRISLRRRPALLAAAGKAGAAKASTANNPSGTDQPTATADTKDTKDTKGTKDQKA